MVFEIRWVAMVFVEVINDVHFPCPHIDFMKGISEVRSKTRTKVSCTKYENLGGSNWLWFWLVHDRRAQGRESETAVVGWGVKRGKGSYWPEYIRQCPGESRGVGV